MKLTGKLTKESKSLNAALSPRSGGGKVVDVVYGSATGESVVNDEGVAVIPPYPVIPQIKVQDVLYNNVSVVNDQGNAIIPIAFYSVAFYVDDTLIYTELVQPHGNCNFKYGTNEWCLINGGTVVPNITENITSNLVLYAKYEVIDIWDGIPIPSLSGQNGCTIQGGNVIDNAGVFSVRESSAGYEGFNIKLNNLVANESYKLTFDLRFYDTEFFSGGQYVCGYKIDTTNNTNYNNYSSWPNNLTRDLIEHAYTETFTASTNTEYLTFNICGLSDNHANYLYIKNMMVCKEIT